MDKKFEDKIAKMAFGELSEAEAAEVRAHAAANADAAKMLASYEALRSDLRMMRDVPPDQLSKERLQNAILTQGLKPKPVRRAFPWVWASSLAVMGALALVLVLKLPPGSSPEGGAVAMNEAPILGPDDGQFISRPLKGFGDQLGFTDYVPVSTEPKEVAPVDNEATKEPIRTHSITRINRTFGGRVYKHETDRHNRPALGEGDIKLMPVSTLAAPVKKAPESLVLIKSDKDDSTGASSAVELHQTQDVIVSS